MTSISQLFHSELKILVASQFFFFFSMVQPLVCAYTFSFCCCCCFVLFFNQLEAIYFTILQWVLSYIEMKQPWIYMCSPSRSPLPPPSPPNPSRSSQCTRFKHLSHASNLGWWSVSSQIIYMFRCCSLETSHPHLLPQSPKVCSIHLCLFFYFAYRVIINIFLNSIYMCQYTVMVFIFLAYFTLYNGLQFHPSHQN